MAQTKKQNKVAIGGNVKISAYKGKRKIKQISAKNNATFNLFNFLLDCLAGDLKQNNRPAYLQIGAVTDINTFDAKTPSVFATTKLNNVSINSYIADGQGNITTQGNITNQFYMLYSAFATGGDSSSVYPKVFILKDSGGGELAEVSLTKQTTIEIDPNLMNYSLLIDWSISFQNPTLEALEVIQQ